MFSTKERKYYSRQILIEEFGEVGQEKLKHAKVLIIGAGGLGCPVLQYIAAAGVGTIGIVDGDTINISNLHRQTLFTINDVGKFKAEVAKNVLVRLNPYISIETYPNYLNADNAIDIFRPYDFVVDCTDNFSTRYLINDACVFLDKPFVSGSIYRFEGQLSVFNYNGGPTLRCVFPQVAEKQFEMNCSLSGVIGVLPGMVGLLQANEIIKIILKLGEISSGFLFVFNAKLNDFTKFKIQRNSNLDYAQFFKEGKLHQENYEISCNSENGIDDISQQELLESQIFADCLLLDVRELFEEPEFEARDVLHIPLSELENKVQDIPKVSHLIVACKSGVRSKTAIEFLKEKIDFEDIRNLRDGINEQFISVWKNKKN